MYKSRRQLGFTIIELLVVVSIIALLIGILLPAIGKARDNARLTQSQANLRNLATAHAGYSAEWGDKQLSFIPDSIAAYGNNESDAFRDYAIQVGPPSEIILGWENGILWILNPLVYSSFQPINLSSSGPHAYWGAFRLINAGNFNTYLNGRFYDPVFYAPKDKVVLNMVEQALDSPNSYTSSGSGLLGGQIGLSSYVLSPAAMFNAQILSKVPGSGNPGTFFTDPWSVPAGFRTPSYSAALFPDQKTHMLEHHWLQGNQVECNPAFGNTGTYEGCEPFYFNHAWASVPVTLFFDGHIEGFGVRQAEKSDARNFQQAGYGLWSRDTPLGPEGYQSTIGYDFAETSYHILTTDGIRGRDKGAG